MPISRNEGRNDWGYIPFNGFGLRFVFFFRNVLYIDGVRLLEILFMSSDRLSTDELQILQAAALGVVL